MIEEHIQVVPVNAQDLSMCRLFCLLMVVLAVMAFPVPAGEISEENGVRYIRNGSEPAEGEEVIELKELWRAGGEDDEILFGSIVAATEDAEGNIYLLDAQLSVVQVYGPDGTFQKTLSREGEGPGEIQRADDILIMPDGTVGVVHFFTGKVVRFDTDGIPAGTIYPGVEDPTRGGLRSLRNLDYRGGSLVGSAGMMTIVPGESGQRIQYLARFDEKGAELVRYLEKSEEVNFGNQEYIEKDSYFVDNGGWALGPDGLVYAAPDRDAYRIHAYGPDGSLNRVIERDYGPRKRTQEEKDRVLEGVVMIINGQRVQPEAEIEDHAACISNMQVTGDGFLWIQNSHGGRDQADGIMVTYDVFDPDGHFVKQVAIACEGNAEDDVFFFMERNIILARGMRSSWLGMFGGTESSESDEEIPVMEIVCYEMPPLN